VPLEETPRGPDDFDASAEDLYDQAPCGYLSTRPDGTIVRVNQTLLDWLKQPREAVLGTRMQALLSVGSRIYYETHYAPLIRMQGFGREMAFELVGADRRVLPVLLNARQVVDEAGAPRVIRITLFDSTERRRYERELLLSRRKAEQVAKDKSDLVAMLSHDIRNPLNAIMGVVQLLECSGLSDAQQRYLGILKSSSENMLSLLTHVLELSKAESSGFALDETTVSIGELVGEVVRTFELQAEEKGVALTGSVDARIPPAVLGDPIALRQVLTNLVGNAVKFTAKGSVVVTARAIELESDAVELEFSVADTGIGIPADRLDKIFNEFTQASYETAVRFGGSGLGLAITRKLLALYGSKVQIDSTVDVGSTFSFVLRLPIPATVHA